MASQAGYLADCGSPSPLVVGWRKQQVGVARARLALRGLIPTPGPRVPTYRPRSQPLCTVGWGPACQTVAFPLVVADLGALRLRLKAPRGLPLLPPLESPGWPWGEALWRPCGQDSLGRPAYPVAMALGRTVPGSIDIETLAASIPADLPVGQRVVSTAGGPGPTPNPNPAHHPSSALATQVARHCSPGWGHIWCQRAQPQRPCCCP